MISCLGTSGFVASIGGKRRSGPRSPVSDITRFHTWFHETRHVVPRGACAADVARRTHSVLVLKSYILARMAVPETTVCDCSSFCLLLNLLPFT